MPRRFVGPSVYSSIVCIIAKGTARWAGLLPQIPRPRCHQRRGSDADDADQACQPGEVPGVARVEIQIIGMRCRGDQQIGESATRPSSFVDHSSDDKPIAACGCRVEGNRLGAASQPPATAFGAWPPRSGRPRAGAGGQLGSGDGGNRDLVGQGGGNGGVVPVDHDRGSSRPEVMSPGLVDGPVEIPAESAGSIRTVVPTRFSTSSRGRRCVGLVGIGRNRPPALPLRVTTNVSPAATASITLALSLRSSSAEWSCSWR